MKYKNLVKKVNILMFIFIINMFLVNSISYFNSNQNMAMLYSCSNASFKSIDDTKVVDCLPDDDNNISIYSYYSNDNSSVIRFYGWVKSGDTFAFPIDPVPYGGHSKVSNLIIKNHICTLNLDSNKIKANFNITSNYYSKINALIDDDIDISIIKNHYYMKTNIIYKYIHDGSTICSLNEVEYLSPENLTIRDENYLKDNMPNSCKNLEGVPKFGYFNISLSAMPTDMKCDFDMNGTLDSNEIHGFNNKQVYTNLKTFTDSDSDGWDDVGTLGYGHDLCPGELGINKYQGCNNEYTKINCTGNIKFQDNKLKIENGDFGKELHFDKDDKNTGIRIVNKRWYSNSDIIYSPKKGSGFYSYYYYFFFIGYWGGNCELRFNGAPACNINGFKITSGDSIKLYKYKTLLPTERGKEFHCNAGEIFPSIDSSYKYQFSTILGDSFKDFKRDYITGEIYNPNKINSVRCNLNTKICSFKGKEVKFKNITDLSKSIKIYKDGNLIKDEKVDPEKIALQAQKIRLFNDENKLEHFVNKSVDLMSKYNIIENLTYNSVLNKTKVKISLRDNPSSVQNLTIYQTIPKEVANSVDDIKFINNGGGELIVLDKEPVIGWYFNDTSDTDVEYEVDGDINDSGTIIVTQEPILFNEGELIINYREGKTGCADGEVHLYDLEDLTDSHILEKNTGNYQVCIADLNSSINLYGDNTHIRYLNISSYELNGNISSNFSELTNKSTISTDDSNIYWDMRIQEDNPNGNFSCLGSYKELGKSTLFGDCGYVPKNRIWLHLGADYLPPTTKISYPYVSHQQKVYLDSEDNIGGSGFKNLTYRIVDETSWTTTTNNHVELDLRCNNDWGCKKVIEAYAYDNAGLKEENKLFEVNIIDKGSACQADCMSKPSPNRYVKECNNMNGCNFYDYDNNSNYDNGEYVSGLCNFLTEDSWVKFNSTHDIKCPNGPFRKTMFTDQRLDILNSACENIIKTPYPITINGEQLIMDIISCDNPYNKK